LAEHGAKFRQESDPACINHFGGEARGGYGPAHVVRNPSCAGPTTRGAGAEGMRQRQGKRSDQGERRARRQSQNCKTEFPADAAETVSLVRNPLGAEIHGVRISRAANNPRIFRPLAEGVSCQLR